MSDFITSDFGECAALRMHGIEPLDHFTARSWVTFRYAPDPKIDPIIREYRTSPMKRFEAEIRNVAQRVRDIRAQQESRQ